MVPLGLSVAEAIHFSSSEDKSIKSVQSKMALEARKSPKRRPNLDKTEETSCKTSITSLTEPTNSEEETFKHSGSNKPERALAPEGMMRLWSRNPKKMNVMVGNLDDFFVEERAIGRRSHSFSRFDWWSSGLWNECYYNGAYLVFVGMQRIQRSLGYLNAKGHDGLQWIG